MKNKLSISRIALNFLLAVVIGLLAVPMLGAGLPVAAGIGAGVFSLGTGVQIALGANQAVGGLYMALQTEVWVADIMDTLFYENEFLNLAVDHSSYVTNKTVHIPQAGGNPTVVKNRTEDVADIQRRTDTELTYSLDNYTTDPYLVKDIENLQISYDKRQSIQGQHIATIGDTIAVETLQKWAVSPSTTHVLRTSGGTTGMLPHATATGTRNLLVTNDFARAAAIMDIDKVPKAGRFSVVPTAMFYGLFSDAELVNQQALIGKDMLVMGVVAKLMGFNIITRGEVVRYTSATTNTIRAAAAAAAATDCAGAVCFSRFMVSQALGEVKVYYNAGEARSYGDLMSTEVNHGASVLRAANVGRVTIAQGYTAP
jgi:hypothetical protein